MDTTETARVARTCIALAFTVLLGFAANTQAEPSGIILYSASNWTGDSLTFHESNITNLGEVGWNDKVRSFTVTGGTWYMYRDDNWDGNKAHDVAGPFGVGNHTFGDCTDCFSAQATSLLRMPEKGMMVFEHTKFRGRHLTVTSSAPKLRHEHDVDTGFLGLESGGPEPVWGDKISSRWIGDGDWIGYDDSGYRGYSGNLLPGLLRNDTISSLYRVDDRGGSEVTSVDDRLERPRNPVALDSGNWGETAVTASSDPATLALPPNRGIVSQMDIRLNGFAGTFYTTCASLAMFHAQHLIRLPNKKDSEGNTRAYFAVTQSNRSADLEEGVGIWLVFRLDKDAYDPVTDRAVDTPGTDGEYVWSQEFSSSSAIGDWNHPGKMAVLGGVLVMAAEQWGSSWCDGGQGADTDAVLFYDVRDPESPKYWGAITGDQFGTAQQDREVLGDPANTAGAERRVINSVSLDSIGGEVLLGVGGNSNRKLFKAKGGRVAPHPSAWEHVGESGSMSNSHGNNFNSFEQNATGPEAGAGTERIVFFDGSIKDECNSPVCLLDARTMLMSSVLFGNGGGGDPTFTVPAGNSIKAQRGAPGAGGSWTWPAGGDKSEDASSVHVTTAQQPVVYIPELSWDAQPWTAGYADDIDAVEVIPPAFSLQRNLKDGPYVDNGEYGYFNRFYQVHLPKPATRVTTSSDSGEGSLRSVIADLPLGGVIDFAPGLNGAVLNLLAGELAINKALTIDASGLASGITISGGNSSRVLSIGPVGDLRLIGVTVSGGVAPGLSGGGIRSEGKLELLHCRVTNNTANLGGGIFIENGSVRLEDTTVSSNTATTAGGGIGVLAPGSSVEITRSTISFNTAVKGSGIVTYGGQVEASNSTISNNLEGSGGSGIWAEGEAFVSLTHCTIDDEVNTASASSPTSMLNTIALSVVGDVSSRGANLFGTHTGSVVSGTAPTINPVLGLGSLGNNGGLTLTQPPLSGSPAIDAGTYIAGVSAEDQRRFRRGPVPDIGAVETPDLNLDFLNLPSAPLIPKLNPKVSGYASTVSFRTSQASVGARPTNPSSIVEISVNGGPFVATVGGSSSGASEYLPTRSFGLNVGANSVTVRVSAYDRSIEKISTIVITREPASSDANLSFLATNTMDLDPVFDSAITTYDAGVTSARNVRLWAEARTRVANVQVRVNGGDYHVVPPATGIAAGNQHSLAVREIVRSVSAWGSDRDLSGIDDPANQSVVDGSVTNAVAVAGGFSHSLALATTGRVTAWGSDAFGQTSVPLLTGGLEIAAGGNHSLALVSGGGGKVMAWGDNSLGQTTVPAAALSGVIRVSAGQAHSLALKTDGTVVAWGDDGDEQTSGIPVGLSNVVAIAAGFHHSLALKSDGTVVRWGEELNGGLSDVPGDLAGVVAIAAGDGVSLALKGNGEIVAWGGLADCETESLVSGATAIAVGRAHRLAINGDHQVIAWGSNNAGQTDVPLSLSTPMPTSPLLELSPGANTIEVLVTAESGATKLYTVSIEQDDSAVVETFDPAPSSLDSVFVGSKHYWRNVTLVGQTVHYRVTGSLAGNVYGTDEYTIDSTIATAAVHAGVLAVGEEGIVSIDIVPGVTTYVGTLANGVLSKNFSQTPPLFATAFRMRPFTGDAFAAARETYSVENGVPPIDFRCYGNRLGETLNYLVVGSAPDGDPSDPPSAQLIWYQHSATRYTQDSPLGVAAVHAGILQPGETGVVAVTIGPSFSFVKNEEGADTLLRNGVKPSKRGDNHSSLVGGSYTLQAVVGFGTGDSDGDGLDDAEEIAAGTNVYGADTDMDGMSDKWEIDHGLDPLVNDAAGDDDEDGLSNLDENLLGTDPDDDDTDDDLLPDFWEAMNGTNPLVPDADGNPDDDLWNNLEEYQNGTDPLEWNAPISLAAVCGDSSVDAPEQCDDGNEMPGDCCSSTCQFEAVDSVCGDDGVFCTADRCDGAGSCVHPHDDTKTCEVVCALNLSLTGADALGSLEIQIDYAAAEETAQERIDLECTASEDLAGAAFVADDDAQALDVAFVAPDGLSGARSLATCTFALAAGSEVLSQDFVVVDENAEDLDGAQEESPRVAAAVVCEACGAPASGASPPKTSDALALLRCAVGARECSLCTGDVNGSGSVTTTDALAVLRRAVGQPIVFACECGG